MTEWHCWWREHLLHLAAVGLLSKAGVHGVDLQGAQAQDVAQLRQPSKLAAVPLHHHCSARFLCLSATQCTENSQVSREAFSSCTRPSREVQRALRLRWRTSGQLTLTFALDSPGVDLRV